MEIDHKRVGRGGGGGGGGVYERETIITWTFRGTYVY